MKFTNWLIITIISIVVLVGGTVLTIVTIGNMVLSSDEALRDNLGLVGMVLALIGTVMTVFALRAKPR
ncbi:hypothetical protein FJZ31_25900 [Candidatus Poribacteria bacterium]|nr:hypothetical protein [Candidatus Poribacteria bacterium]